MLPLKSELSQQIYQQNHKAAVGSTHCWAAAHYTTPPDTTADYAHLAIGDAFKLACWRVALLPNLRLRREQNSQLSIDRGPTRG